jgi:phosphatidylethanolamine-binding protein (PEBP) family uncharacterized protein
MANRVNVLLIGLALLAVVGVACSSSDGGESGGEGDGAAAASSGEEGAAVGDALSEYKLTQEVDFSAIEVTSARITRVRRIGLEYSCATERSPTGFEFGQNLSPPLVWTGVPAEAKSLVLVVTGTDNLIPVADAQAGSKANEFTPPYPEPLRVHWVMWNIPPTVTELAEAIATTTEAVSVGATARQGMNYEGFAGWSGPCPSPIGLAREYKSTQGGYNYTYGAPMRGIDDFFFHIYALDTELDLGPETTKDALLEAIDGHIIAAGELNGKYAQRRKF